MKNRDVRKWHAKMSEKTSTEKKTEKGKIRKTKNNRDKKYLAEILKTWKTDCERTKCKGEARGAKKE